MALSNYLAEIWGISLVVIPLAMLIKEKHLKKIFAMIEAEEHNFCWGLVAFVIGLAVVLSHNIWVKDWQVVITIFGWLSLLKGLAFMFLPEQVKAWSKKMETASYIPYALTATVIIGLIITYLGFTA